MFYSSMQYAVNECNVIVVITANLSMLFRVKAKASDIFNIERCYQWTGSQER